MSISAGTVTQFEAGQINFCAVAKLTASDAIVAYVDVDDSNNYKAVHVDLTTDPLTIGTPANFDTTSNGANGIDICRLSDTTFCIIYVSDTGATSENVEAVAGSLSGSTITFGTAQSVATGVYFCNHQVGITPLSSSKAIATYRDGSDTYNYGVVLDISGTAVTVNTPAAIQSAIDTLEVDIIALDSSTAIAVYKQNISSNLYARALTSITTTFSVGAEATIDNTPNRMWDNIGYQYLAKVSSTSAVAIYQVRDQTSLDFIVRGAVMTLSGTTITAGTPVNLTVEVNGYDEIPTVTALSTGVFMVAYSTGAGGCSGSGDGRAFTVSVSGTTVTSNSDEVTFEATEIFYNSLDANGTNVALVAYQDQCDSNKGKAVLLTYAQPPQFYTGTNTLTYRSDLPSGVTDVKRGGLLVRSDLTTAIIGSGVANSVMLAKATSADTYGSWTDITDSHPTGAEVTAVAEI